MKNVLLATALITASSSAFAFDVFDYGQTQAEATSRAMQRCHDTSPSPGNCRVIQVNKGDFGPYATWQVQVADW